MSAVPPSTPQRDDAAPAAVQDADLQPLAQALLAVAVHVHGAPADRAAGRKGARSGRALRPHTSSRLTRR
jgi:hypothetical protein